MPRLPQFSLRTLIVVMMLGGPLCAVALYQWQQRQAAQAFQEAQTKRRYNRILLEYDQQIRQARNAGAKP
jgi:type II secretory pathway pseudopilin PulG